MPASSSSRTADAWSQVRERLHERGLRWTPQRRLLVEVLAGTDGHITGAELVERCRAADPLTTPSTVYRTLDVLEEIGLIRHAHGLDGREEFHVRPAREHGHLHCAMCQRAWEIDADEVRSLVAGMRAARGFHVDLGHLSVVGTCRDCLAAEGES
jgi:Fur family ferric uptake transcriptional regulator